LPISELKIKDIFKGVLREQDTFFIYRMRGSSKINPKFEIRLSHSAFHSR